VASAGIIGGAGEMRVPPLRRSGGCGRYDKGSGGGASRPPPTLSPNRRR